MRPIPTRSPRSLFSTLLVGFSSFALAACGGDTGDPGAADVTVYQGAKVIPGDGGAAIENATFTVRDGRFLDVGPTGAVEVPDGATIVDLTGATVMPALVNAHFHLSSDAAERADQLRRLAYYGASAAISLGLDDGDAAFDMRGNEPAGAARSLTAGRGITAPEEGRSEVPHWVTTEDEARAAVRELAAQNVDFVKIWVDDRGGQYERLSPELYGAVIEEAHANGLRVTAHIFRLEDAKGLLGAGIDAFAHGIRDQDADDEVVELWLSRPEVVLVPNLPGPGVPVDYGWLSGTLSADRIAEMQAGSVDRPAAQESFGIQARNLVRLHAAGIPIAFGTDGGSPWAVHHELEDMVRAGLSEADVLHAATGASAALLRLDDLGVIAPDKAASFVVLNADPLVDITNTRAIRDVYIDGARLDREAMSAEFLDR